MKKLLSFALVLLATVASAKIRPPAVPLVTTDPFFSIWLFGDKLTEKDAEHWGWSRPMPLNVSVELDGAWYRVCGTRPQERPALEQLDCDVTASQTIFRFRHANDVVELRFSQDTRPDDLARLSRPVVYLTVTRRGADGRVTHPEFTFEATSEIASEDDTQISATEVATIAGRTAIRMGRVWQKPLSDAKDGSRINWGYFWLVKDRDFAVLAYDDIWDVEFLGNRLVGWWDRAWTKEKGTRDASFRRMLAQATADYAGLLPKLDAFDRDLRAKLEKRGGVHYADLAILAHRQSLAACKIVARDAKTPYMFSKENASNGCMGTVDLLYPQMPHLLWANPELAKATIRPILEYSESPFWPFPFAPHDVGRYPVGNGQAYGFPSTFSPHDPSKPEETSKNLMPFEETGNMLIVLAALAKTEGNADFVAPHAPLLRRWAEYLRGQGWDPGSQLCTDDFAGRLAHNANLSIKAIVALRAYAYLCELRGEKDVAADYAAQAKGCVPSWLKAAEGGAHGGYRLAFDQPGTHSLKYNLVWDRILGFDLFPKEVAERELAAYRKLAEPAGVRLDNRARYTKSDWIVWCGLLTGRRADFDFMVEPLWHAMNTTTDRLPMTDWYNADDATQVGFRARSVVGAFYLPMLDDGE